MIYFQGTTDFRLESPCAVTLGKFDGVHKGHQKLMQRIKDHEKNGVISCVFTLNPREEELILTQEEQRNVIASLGISALIKCPFVPEISSMHPDAFVREVLQKRLHAVYVAVGSDFRFGFRREGSASFLKENEDRYGFAVDVIEKECYQGREISSTYIREAMNDGNMELAQILLGRPFQVEGTIIHGRHLGTRMGMPTVNIIPPPSKLLPPNGVYESTSLVDGIWYRGVTNIGVKPTVKASFRGVETFLFDCSQDLYGKDIHTCLHHFERPEIRFESIDALKEQIQTDILRGREYFSE